MQKSAVIGIVLGVLGLLGSSTSNGEESPTDFRKSIELVLAQQQAANEEGESAEQLARRFYTDDVVIIGEGEQHPSRGIAEAVRAMKEWNDYLGPGGQKKCRFDLENPVVASGSTASTFVVLSCKANPPTLKKDEKIRQLFVWTKTPQGWKVSLEMWQSGGFGK